MKALARNDIIAMKQADHIVLQSIYMHGRSNIATITCAKQTGEEEFLTWDIKVASAVHFLNDSLVEDNCICSFLIHNSFINWTWQTVTGSLFTEDELELVWMPDAESTYPLIQAGFHCDILKMIVYRKKHRFHYNIGTLIAQKGKIRMISGLTKTPTKEMVAL